MALKYLVLSLFFIGIVGVHAQSEPSVSNALQNLPPELQGKVDEKQIQEIQNKSTQLFKEKCEKNGGPSAFTNAENAFKNFTSCLSTLVDTAVLQKEIDDAKPNGQVDEVFKKYCAKTPEFKQCFHAMLDAAKPCMTVEEKNNLKTVYNVSEQLAEFICFKEGDRIALFIAEGGPECLQEKQEEIQICVNRTLGADVKLDMEDFNADSIPKIAFNDKECGQMTELEHCVVASLERCDQPTSANIFESLFKFIRKATPCKDIEDKLDATKGAGSEKKNVRAGGNLVTAAAATLLLTATTLLL